VSCCSRTDLLSQLVAILSIVRNYYSILVQKLTSQASQFRKPLTDSRLQGKIIDKKLVENSELSFYPRQERVFTPHANLAVH
jgi:hypothetical protein